MNISRVPPTRQLAFSLPPIDSAPEAPVARLPASPWVEQRVRSGVPFDRQLEQARVQVPSRLRSDPAAEPAPPVSPLPFQQPMTARQRSFLFALAREEGLTQQDIHLLAAERFGVTSIAQLDRRQASDLIRSMQGIRALPVAS